MGGRDSSPWRPETKEHSRGNDCDNQTLNGSAADGQDGHRGGHAGGRFHWASPASLLPPEVQRASGPFQAPPAGAAPLDNQRVAIIAPRNPAEFLGAPFPGAMGVTGATADGAAPFHPLGHLDPFSALQPLETDSDGQMWPPASAPLRACSGTTGLMGPAAPATGGEIELPAPHDPAQVEAFWRLMGAPSSGMPPQASLLVHPPQLPLLAALPPIFPQGLPLGMELDAAVPMEAANNAAEEEEAAKEAEKAAIRRQQLRESQARLREKKRQAEKEEMARAVKEMEVVRAQTAAARAERAALLAVQCEYCRHLAIRTAVLNGLDPEWQAKQRQAISAVPWAGTSPWPHPLPSDLPWASGFDEVINYSRQYVLTVRMAVEDALEDGLDAETVAAVEATVQGGPDPRTAFLQLVRTRESLRKALAALKYERPQPCADAERWGAAAAAVVDRCPPDALLRLRGVSTRVKERRNCVKSALERVVGDLHRLLPAEDFFFTDGASAAPCCWAAAAKGHLNVATVAATMASCCAEIDHIFQDVANFFQKDLGMLITALVIANCEPDWPNWPAVAAEAVALAEQRGVIPPRSQAH